MTAFPVGDGDDAIPAADAIIAYFASDAPRDRVTVSSDGGGCLPTFDRDGRMIAMDIGRPAAVSETLTSLLSRGVALAEALPIFTRNVADLLRLPSKGRVQAGASADLVVLDDAHRIATSWHAGSFSFGMDRRSNWERSRPRVRKQIHESIEDSNGSQTWLHRSDRRRRGQGGAGPNILRKFIDVSGGEKARIVIIPTASTMEDTGRRYEKIFRKLGADEAKALPFTSRDDANKREWLDYIEKATAIFITGGNQLRLTTILGGTPVARAIRRANANGVTVGGTSAGAAILSEHMIAFGAEATPPRGRRHARPRVWSVEPHHDRPTLSPARSPRALLTALAYNPFAVGVGLDEDTAAFIDSERKLTVVGNGALTIVDASELTHSSSQKRRRETPCA